MNVIEGTDEPEVLKGTRGKDIIAGLGGDDTIKGRAGADEADGGAGDDRIFGEDGDDILRGGDGNDRLNGGSGANEAHGDAGNDRYFKIDAQSLDRFDGGAGSDWIDLSLFEDARGAYVVLSGDAVYVGDNFAEEFRIMTLTGVENATGSRFDDTLLAAHEGSRLFGKGGDDQLTGGGADDVLNGGAGNDILKGAFGDDLMIGGAGNDTFHGNVGGHDVMKGGGGNDTFGDIDGAATITGGKGSDTFVFSVFDTFDGTTITDFRIGQDKIDLTTVGPAGPRSLAEVVDAATTTGSGATLVTELDLGGKSVFLEGIAKADLVAFMFDFA